jgi:hypothetical protein
MFAGPFKTNAEVTDSFRQIAFRSSAYAVIAYYIALMLEKVVTAGGAAIRGFEVDFSYNELRITSNSQSWDQEGVLLIYLFPFVIQIMVFIFLNIRFYKLDDVPHFKKLFVLWLMFFIVYRLLGIFPAHLWFETGIYHAVNWLYISGKIIIFAAVLSLLFFFITGYRILRGLVALTGYYHFHIREMGVENLILGTLIIPLLCVSLTALLFYLPEPPLEELTGFVTIIFLAIFSFQKLKKMNPERFSFKELIDNQRHPIFLVIIAIVGVVALRFLFGILPLIV